MDNLQALEAVEGALNGAKYLQDFFGYKPEEVKSIYRKLCLCVHPDKFEDDQLKIRANSAFAKLTDFRTMAEDAIGAGKYGDKIPLKKETVNRISSPTYAYNIVGKIGESPLDTIFEGFYEQAGNKYPVLVHISADHTMNPFMKNEANVIRRLCDASSHPEAAHFAKYLPKLVDHFTIVEADKVCRAVSVYERLDALYSWQSIRSVYPKGVDCRDLVWMLNRMFEILAWSDRLGFLHGAVLPPNIFVQDEEVGGHRGILARWHFAKWQNSDGRFGAVQHVMSDWKDFYPPEVLTKDWPSAKTDLYMLAASAIYLAGGEPKTKTIPSVIEAPIRDFLLACMNDNSAKRPDAGASAMLQFKQVSEKVYGKRSYHVFRMPTKP